MGCQSSLCFEGLRKEKNNNNTIVVTLKHLFIAVGFFYMQTQMNDLKCRLQLLNSITLPVFFCKSPQVALVKVLIARDPENFMRQITDNCQGPKETGEQNSYKVRV